MKLFFSNLPRIALNCIPYYTRNIPFYTFLYLFIPKYTLLYPHYTLFFILKFINKIR